MNAIEFKNVSKKFKKGEKYDSLRDFIPSIVSKLFSRNGNNKLELQEREFWALKDVSFCIRKGETLGIIGPNGAGKSTILNILSKILVPTKGEIVINGRLTALIELGAGLHPDLTGRENIFLSGVIRGMKRKDIEKKFDSIVEFSGLNDFINTPVKRYSSGMYVRLGFSVAAHLDPEILLIDEVLAVGDIGFRAKCHNFIKELQQNGVTIIFISHNLPTVSEMCRRTALLENGRIKFIGNTDEAIHILHQDTFLGTLQENKSEIVDPLIGEILIKGGAEIKSVKIFDDNKNEALFLKDGNQYIVEAHVRFEKDITNPVAGCFVWDNQKRIIYDANTFTMRINTGKFSAGQEYTFRWYLKPHLLSNHYNLGISISHVGTEHYFYDRKASALKLCVKSDSRAEGIVDMGAQFEVIR